MPRLKLPRVVLLPQTINLCRFPDPLSTAPVADFVLPAIHAIDFQV